MEEIRKVVRWRAFALNVTFDHACDKLPVGQRFHKFKFLLTTEHRRAFTHEKQLVLQNICPYCGKNCVFEIHRVFDKPDKS